MTFLDSIIESYDQGTLQIAFGRAVADCGGFVNESEVVVRYCDHLRRMATA